jgi:hypothetical protein
MSSTIFIEFIKLSYLLKLLKRLAVGLCVLSSGVYPLQASAACDKAKLNEVLHWSANNVFTPLEDSVKDRFQYIVGTWPGSNPAKCMYIEGRKCLMQQARDARDHGFHHKAKALAAATQAHNPNAESIIGACSDQEVSDAVGGT